jgi:ADP-ribose pyrophosphatase
MRSPASRWPPSASRPPPDRAVVPDPTESDTGQATDDLTETVVASRVLHQGRYLTFRIDTIERADGSRAERDVAGHPGAVAILAIDPDGEVLLVRQFRSPAGRVLLEIPAGTLDVDPATGAVEDHALAARRELEEETGYRAASWRHLTSFWTAPGFATELMHLWLATDLRPADGDRLGPDEDEHLRLDRLPIRDAIAAAERGEIADAKSLVGLLWLDRLGLDGAPRVEGAPGRVSADPSAGAAVPGPVRVSYRLSLIEYLGAIVLLARSSRGMRAFGAVITVSGAYALIAGLDPLTWLPPLVFGPLVLSGAFTLPFAWYALRKRRELVEQPTTLLLDATGVTFASSFGESHLDWSLYARIREVGDWFFFDTGAGTNFMMPKRIYSPPELATFRKLIAAAGFGPDGRRQRPIA